MDFLRLVKECEREKFSLREKKSRIGRMRAVVIQS